jgi:glutathione S-transferase
MWTMSGFSVLLPLFVLSSSSSVDALFAGKPRFFNSGSCPYAQRAWIALEECGVDYEKVMVDLENKSQEFLDLYAMSNPLPGARAKVPLLECKTRENDSDEDSSSVSFLCESLVVAEFVAEQFGSPDQNQLLPASAIDRATMRLFTELCGSSFSYVPLLRAKEGDKLDAAIKSFQDGLVATNAFLKHHNSDPFLLGNQFTLAECNAAPFVQRACIILPAFTSKKSSPVVVNPMDICDELGLDHLKKWMQAVLVRPSVIDTGVPEEILLERTGKMLERFAEMEKQEV